MSGVRRITDILVAILMVGSAVLMLVDTENGYYLAVGVLMVGLLVLGIQQIFYYFFMARHMVGGISLFYKGIFLLDAGLFALCLDSMPTVVTMVFLLAVFGFTGAVGVLRGLEMKNIGAPWKFKFATGVAEVLIAIGCVVFMDSSSLFSCVFAIGLLGMAVEKTINAFSKTAIVHVETPSEEQTSLA